MIPLFIFMFVFLIVICSFDVFMCNPVTLLQALYRNGNIIPIHNNVNTYLNFCGNSMSEISRVKITNGSWLWFTTRNVTAKVAVFE